MSVIKTLGIGLVAYAGTLGIVGEPQDAQAAYNCVFHPIVITHSTAS